jgi:hypothetical protein
MGKECDREEAAKIDSAPKEAVAGAEMAATAGEEHGVGGPQPVGTGTIDLLSADE